jgi:esterase/lipase superfamily enzyme
MTTLTNFTNSYIITNRTSPLATSYGSITPITSPAGGMWWYTATNPPGVSYNPEATDYAVPAGVTPTTAPPTAFTSALEADLAIAKANGCPQITVLIHGLGNLFTYVVTELATLGNGFQANPSPYAGLVIAFDWPSYDGLDGAAHYAASSYAFPAPAVAGTIRGNIACSVAAFTNLMTMLAGYAEQGFKINFICHSEGNYMMMLGMAAQPTTGAFVNQVLLVAADINTGALQTPASGAIGQGLPIASLSKQVTVYFSSGDDVLPGSEGMFPAHHNPSYPGRLGLEGPSAIATGELPSNVVMMDCAAVINDQVSSKLSPSQLSHSSYFYLPQVLTDWSQTLNGVAAENVANRTGKNDLNSSAFAMSYVPSANTMSTREAAARARSSGERA